MADSHFLRVNSYIPFTPNGARTACLAEKHGDVTLQELLAGFFAPENLDGPIYHCEKCSTQNHGALEYRTACKTTSIRKLPGVLRLHLKRFRWSGARREKIQTHVEFPLSLDLRAYSTTTTAAATLRDTMLLLPDDAGSFVYDLVGVIVHEGRGINSGHYVSYCYNASVGSWIHCNDARVSVASEQTVLQAQGYVLFYAHREATSHVNQMPAAPATQRLPDTPPAKRWCP